MRIGHLRASRGESHSNASQALHSAPGHTTYSVLSIIINQNRCAAEPAELNGEPKKVRKSIEAQQQFGKIIEEFKDEEKSKALRPKLNKFIEDSDAYSMRAMCDLCILNSREYASVLKDIDTAISTHSSPTSETIYAKLTDHYSMRGKIEFTTGRRYGEAIEAG